MAEHWKDIDLALIREASKIHPDFVRMEHLVRDGADVNAVHDLGDENALSDVIEFFLKHGFDPSRDEGRAGAKCITNAFSEIVESVLTKVSFDKHSIAYGTTYYGQVIMRFHFCDRPILITQTNFGEILDAKMVANYRYEEDTHK